MRGKPNSWVTCPCGSPRGFPGTGLCRLCRRKRPATKYFFGPAAEDQLREIYRTSERKSVLSARIAELAEELGYPRNVIVHHASSLGLARDLRKPWTPADLAILRDESGKADVKDIAQQLGRSRAAVAVKMRGLRLSYARSDAWTETELRRIFGVTALRMRDWGDRGWLRPVGDRYERCDVLRFLVTHPEAFDTRTIDVAWMRDMLRRAGVMLADLRAQVGLERAA